MLGKVSRPRNLLKWTRERQGQSGGEREPPLRALHGRKWPTSDWSFEESKTAVGRRKPNFSKCGGDSLSPPVIFHRLIGEAGNSALLDLGAFTCLLCHMTLVGSDTSALKLHFASFALTPQVRVLSPKNVHCKAVLGTQSGMIGG